MEVNSLACLEAMSQQHNNLHNEIQQLKNQIWLRWEICAVCWAAEEHWVWNGTERSEDLLWAQATGGGGGAPGPALHRSHQKHQDLSMTIRIKGKILNAEEEEKDQLMVSLVLVEGYSKELKRSSLYFSHLIGRYSIFTYEHL